MHKCVHAYIHTYVHTYIHTHIHPSKCKNNFFHARFSVRRLWLWRLLNSLRSLVEIYRSFRGSCCLYHPSRSSWMEQEIFPTYHDVLTRLHGFISQQRVIFNSVANFGVMWKSHWCCSIGGLVNPETVGWEAEKENLHHNFLISQRLTSLCTAYATVERWRNQNAWNKCKMHNIFW
jgi:hypothetical protein